MTRNCNTRNYSIDRSVFGGEIDIEDFNTTLPSKKRIHNQIDALNLKTKLVEENNIRKEHEMLKNMTLEELREMKLISNTNGRPVDGLTDEKWQREFQIRKLFVSPYKEPKRQMGGKYSRDVMKWDEEKDGIYHGMTHWQRYCQYINSVLSSIRSGQVDYCYYIYQIMDLLKFHYDTLQTKYCDGYWEVWLK